MSNTHEIVPSTEEFAHILQRYEAAKARDLLYTYEELRELGIDPGFIMALLAVFENKQSFQPAEFDQFSLEVIIGYLNKTHDYYLDRKLLEIEQSIHLLMNAYPSAHPLLQLLNNFYTEYKRHLTQHIEREEEELLPYILQLERASAGAGEKLQAPLITVEQFIDLHQNTEEELEEVRKIMLHYSPPEGNQTIYRILLSQLQTFEKDLAVHALIEDDVLLPRALQLERRLLSALE